MITDEILEKYMSGIYVQQIPEEVVPPGVITIAQSNDLYLKIWRPYIDISPLVTLTADEVKIVDKKSALIAMAKETDATNPQNDNQKRKSRQSTGEVAALAVLKFLGKGIENLDLSTGKAKDYDSPDLKNIGLNLGIKSAKTGFFPMVSNQPKYPEIICCNISNTEVRILGIATVDVLRNKATPRLIVAPAAIPARERKSGFYGIKELDREWLQLERSEERLKYIQIKYRG